MVRVLSPGNMWLIWLSSGLTTRQPLWVILCRLPETLYNTFCRALDEGKEIRVVFCDIKKAFDRVWHAGLLHKFHACGISGTLLDWFKDYLSQRRQRVVLPGVFSDWAYTHAGVPQGSVLGPLLFLIYINDIVKDIGSNIRLFADDTSLYIVVTDPDTSAELLTSDLVKIEDWAEKWLVTFQPPKTNSLVISRKVNKPAHPPLFMQNQQIKEVDSHKHLGLYFSNDGTWHHQIQYIKDKAWTRINTMRKLVQIRPQITWNNIHCFYTPNSRIWRCRLGQLCPVRKRWVRKDTAWSCSNSYWNYTLDIHKQSLQWNKMGFTAEKTKWPQAFSVL